MEILKSGQERTSVVPPLSEMCESPLYKVLLFCVNQVTLVQLPGHAHVVVFLETQCHGQLTWDLLITWLASSWMENSTPSSEANEPMGDRVPDVKTMLRTDPLKSEKAWKTQTHIMNI